MSAKRIIAGFLIAPAIPGLLVLLMQSVAISRGQAEWGTSLFAVLGYVTAIVVGLPAFLLFKQRLSTHLVKYAVFGAMIGLVPACALFLPDILTSWQTRHEHAVLLLGSLWRILLAGAVLGSLSGMVFWLIAIRKK